MLGLKNLSEENTVSNFCITSVKLSGLLWSLAKYYACSWSKSNWCGGQADQLFGTYSYDELQESANKLHGQVRENLTRKSSPTNCLKDMLIHARVSLKLQRSLNSELQKWLILGQKWSQSQKLQKSSDLSHPGLWPGRPYSQRVPSQVRCARVLHSVPGPALQIHIRENLFLR